MRSSLVMSVFASILISGLMPLAGRSSGAGIDKPYDWTIEVTTEKLERQFEYEGSTIKPVAKCHVIYYKVGASDDEKKVYEDIWYHNGRAYGLERKAKFECTEGDGVAIVVKHKTTNPDPEEMKAAANAITRLYLDAFVHKNPIVAAVVKDDSHAEISTAMQEQHWEILPENPDVAIDSQINVFLQSESGDIKQTLMYPSI